mmetsp:Transcript_8511/g.20997  ORF Transcript_8511/g.20997 Transcript_8511/m.20997 type:complete len:224 (+) Transcript_8511:433-1104(+)
MTMGRWKVAPIAARRHFWLHGSAVLGRHSIQSMLKALALRMRVPTLPGSRRPSSTKTKRGCAGSLHRGRWTAATSIGGVLTSLNRRINELSTLITLPESSRPRRSLTRLPAPPSSARSAKAMDSTTGSCKRQGWDEPTLMVSSRMRMPSSNTKPLSSRALLSRSARSRLRDGCRDDVMGGRARGSKSSSRGRHRCIGREINAGRADGQRKWRDTQAGSGWSDH